MPIVKNESAMQAMVTLVPSGFCIYAETNIEHKQWFTSTQKVFSPHPAIFTTNAANLGENYITRQAVSL
jgi:hypothetical protein